MYEIKKVRRKMIVDGEYKMVTLWQCMCKFGTHCATLMLLFDYPKKGIRTRGAKEYEKFRIYTLMVDDVREADNFVFLSLF